MVQTKARKAAAIIVYNLTASDYYYLEFLSTKLLRTVSPLLNNMLRQS